jgi:hypothetical protein
MVKARRSGQLVCAIMASCLSPWACSRQSAGSVRLPGQLEGHIEGERFQTVTSVRGLPVGVRDGMRTLWGREALDIAEPGTGSSGPDGRERDLPSRRLVAAGCSSDHCLVYYELAAAAWTHRVVLFRWTPSATQMEWGGTAPAGLATIDHVLTAVFSGDIQGPTTVW